jgi:hypothetical protein
LGCDAGHKIVQQADAQFANVPIPGSSSCSQRLHEARKIAESFSDEKRESGEEVISDW